MVAESSDNHYIPGETPAENRALTPDEIADYALDQLGCVIEVHARVVMDTEEDKRLHDEAVQTFRQAWEVGRRALADSRRTHANLAGVDEAVSGS